MPCCLIAAALMVPRLALIYMWLTGYGGRAVETVLWPLLGFFFMPFTTCAYIIGMNETGGFQGWSLLLLIVGVVFDLGGHGSSGSRYRRVVVKERRY